MSSKYGKFVQHVVPQVIRPLRVLWNQIIGFVFLVLAVIIIFATVKRTAADPNGFWVLIAGVGFGLVLAYFGISSFWRARRISRT